MNKLLLSAAAALLLAACGHKSGDVAERSNILAVGSSTVYPFTMAVAEQFQAKHVQSAKPVIKATGTGPGIAAFCAGVGNEHPDIVNASRRMHVDELATCRANGVADVVELEIGNDGLAFVQSSAAPLIKLTRKQAYEALAAAPQRRAQSQDPLEGNRFIPA